MKDYGPAAWPILNWGPDPESQIVQGFRSAADVIIDYILEHGEFSSPDQLIYPCLFDYRHSVELMLKRILRMCRDLGTALPKNWPTSHNVGGLWLWAFPTVQKLCTGVDVKQVTPQLVALAQMDIDSQRFRYQLTTKGTPSHPPMQHIDLVEVRKVTQELNQALDAIEDQLLAKLGLEFPPAN